MDKKKKIIYLLSIIHEDTEEKIPIGIFDSKKELKRGIKEWNNYIDSGATKHIEIAETYDYQINEFYLNKNDL